MKTGIHLCALLLLLPAFPEVLRADVVHLANGQDIRGTILSTDGKSLTIEAAAGGGTARVPYPLSLVESVRFERDQETVLLLESGDPARLPELEGLWARTEPFLGMEGSDSGVIGLKLVRMYLAAGTKKAGALGVTVAEAVKRGDWKEQRRTEATRLRLSALAAAGKVEQAMKEAEELENLPGADGAELAAARVRASFVKAELSWTKLRELEEEWPKWPLMPDMAAEHRRLLNDSLDRYLFPVAFHAELRALCAEGLWRAAEIQRHAGFEEEARRCAREIVEHYPEPEYVSRAEAFLKKKTS